MNATGHICYAFLKGEKLTIKSAFEKFGVSNLPREVGRAIERKFGVNITKNRKDGKTRYGIPCSWFEYNLDDTQENREGRIKMKDYVVSQIGKPQTEREFHISKSVTLL